MRIVKDILFLFLVLIFTKPVENVWYDIVSPVANLVGKELCTDYFHKADLVALNTDLTSQLFGQPFVRNFLLPVLKDFITKPEIQKKALVLSFHGGPGTGKNYVSNMIVERLYKNGRKSSYVHYFNGQIHFNRPSLIDHYIEDLQHWIVGNISKCENSLFIFDEIEKMPVGILDAIKAFIDYDSFHFGQDFRKAMFIFLSKSAMQPINAKTKELWELGFDRKNFKWDQFQVILKDINSHEGALKQSALISTSLIDLVVPFLPLEKHHVKSCIQKEAYSRQEILRNTLIEEILATLDFEPEDTRLFARHGCKNVKNLVAVATKRNQYEVATKQEL